MSSSSPEKSFFHSLLDGVNDERKVAIRELREKLGAEGAEARFREMEQPGLMSLYLEHLAVILEDNVEGRDENWARGELIRVYEQHGEHYHNLAVDALRRGGPYDNSEFMGLSMEASIKEGAAERLRRESSQPQ